MGASRSKPHAIATLLAAAEQGETFGLIRDAPFWAEVGVLIVLAAVASLLAGLWGLKRTALLLVLLLPAYYFFDIWLFVRHSIDLHLIAPTATVALTALGVLLERGLTEEQEKTRMRGAAASVRQPADRCVHLAAPGVAGPGGPARHRHGAVLRHPGVHGPLRAGPAGGTGGAA